MQTRFMAQLDGQEGNRCRNCLLRVGFLAREFRLRFPVKDGEMKALQDLSPRKSDMTLEHHASDTAGRCHHPA